MKVALIGGSGKLGKGFATRLVQTGHEVTIGSRDAAKAQDAAREAGGSVHGTTNLDAAAWSDAAILAIPYQGRRALLEPLRDALRGKIIIDTTVPIDPADMLRTATESGTSAAEETAAIFPDAEVFAAFQTVAHRVLQQPDLRHDVLVAGPTGRKAEVVELIRSMGLHPVDAGPLKAAGLLERMTLLLISINRANKVKESGIRITGLPA
jgi:NADPH-dependent F420 reductase